MWPSQCGPRDSPQPHDAPGRPTRLLDPSTVAAFVLSTASAGARVIAAHRLDTSADGGAGSRCRWIHEWFGDGYLTTAHESAWRIAPADLYPDVEIPFDVSGDCEAADPAPRGRGQRERLEADRCAEEFGYAGAGLDDHEGTGSEHVVDERDLGNLVGLQFVDEDGGFIVGMNASELLRNDPDKTVPVEHGFGVVVDGAETGRGYEPLQGAWWVAVVGWQIPAGEERKHSPVVPRLRCDCGESDLPVSASFGAGTFEAALQEPIAIADTDHESQNIGEIVEGQIVAIV